MKKLAALAAALLCAVALTLCAGARSVYDYDREYDEYDNCYYLYDPYSGDMVGIEFFDGSVWWADGYTEPEEPSLPYEDTEEAYYTEDEGDYDKYQYDIDTMFLEKPKAEVVVADSYYAELRCVLPYGWYPDGCVLERWNEWTSGWETLSDLWIEDNGSMLECTYYDWEIEPEQKYSYRFRFYKYFDYTMTYVASAEVSVTAPPDYPMPYLADSEVSDTTADLTMLVDKRWDPKSCYVSRRTSPSEDWVRVGEITSFTQDAYYDDMLCAVFSDSGLKQETDYYYLFEFYGSDGGVKTLLCSVQAEIHTLCTPDDPEMLTPKAHSDSITITAVVDERWRADGYEVYRYSSRKKKWEKLSESEDFGYYDWKDGVEYLSAQYTDTGLKSAVKYRYMIKLYRDIGGKRKYFSSLKTSAYTLLPAPKLTLGATAKKATLNWSKVSGAAGYEVYVLPVTEAYDPWSGGWYYVDFGYDSDRTTPTQYDTSLMSYNQSYWSNTLRSMDISQFTKKSTIKSGTKTTASYTIKSGKAYVYIVRAYKKVGNTKVYGEFSNQETTDSTSALLNGLTLNSKVTVSEYDLGLIKKALKKCVNSKMTNAEKAAAVYDYVHNAAIYEYDYSKIPTDSIEAILSSGRGQCYQFAVTYQAMMKYLGFDVKLVSGKTSSGGPHWWCELNCAGTSYMIDPQVGGRFLIRYDRMGYYAVTKEKVYD